MTIQRLLPQSCISQIKGCIACPLSRRPVRIIYRGSIPCDILFIGEAAGDSERLLQEPFVGQSGELLNEIISDSIPEAKCGFTNSVLCIPADERLKLRTPKKSEISACSVNVLKIVELVSPKIVIGVGNSGDASFKKLKLKLPYTKIIHPSAILRQGELGELDYARTVDSLKRIWNA